MNVTSRRNAVTNAVRSTAANDVDLDPIFAAIEAHCRAEAEFSAALGRLSDLENELPEERRRSEINMGVLAIVSKDDPRWIEIQRTVMATCKITDEAATNLLNTRPTTPAGVVAVLRRRGLEFPGGYDDGDLSECPWGVEWSVYFHRNLAQAIEAMIVAQRPSQS
jgi:hypothetical protein